MAFQRFSDGRYDRSWSDEGEKIVKPLDCVNFRVVQINQSFLREVLATVGLKISTTVHFASDNEEMTQDKRD
jgi:hypothetical protein